jgi:hypothetical protein
VVLFFSRTKKKLINHFYDAEFGKEKVKAEEGAAKS